MRPGSVGRCRSSIWPTGDDAEGIGDECRAEGRQVPEEDRAALGREAVSEQPLFQRLHRDPVQRGRTGPDHRPPVKEANVADRGFGDDAVGAGQQRVIKAVAFGEPSVVDLPEVADVLDVRDFRVGR
jgi:hypothetical protein